MPLSPDLNVPLEARMAGVRRPHPYFHEWELSLLAKELIINSAEKGDRSLSNFAELASVLNSIKNLENDITGKYPLIGDDILLEVYRIAHRQFPWQTKPNSAGLVRYFKIFSNPALSTVFWNYTGLSPSELYTLGLSTVGHFLRDVTLQLPIQTQAIGLAPELGESFVRLFAADLTALREKANALQSHDHDYAYTLNPLQFHPLVEVATSSGRALLAPIPTYLFRRFTDGMFYDLCNEPGFSTGFGPAFQDYVGEALQAAFDPAKTQILEECSFHEGKNRKDTIDWIVSDSTAHLFVECKTKRIRAEAKTLIASLDALNAELAKMAAAVFQSYKAILDGEAGLYPHWKANGAPIYPVIVTLEEWYAWGTRILDPIRAMVRQLLADAGLDTGILEIHPFTICSVQELEAAAQVMSGVGIDVFMQGKTSGEVKDWAVHAHMMGSFRSEALLIKGNLFPDDMRAINPVLARAR